MVGHAPASARSVRFSPSRVNAALIPSARQADGAAVAAPRSSPGMKLRTARRTKRSRGRRSRSHGFRAIHSRIVRTVALLPGRIDARRVAPGAGILRRVRPTHPRPTGPRRGRPTSVRRRAGRGTGDPGPDRPRGVQPGLVERRRGRLPGAPRRAACRGRRDDLGRLARPGIGAPRPRRDRRTRRAGARLWRRSLVDRPRPGGRPAGGPRPVRPSARACAPADGRGRRRLPAAPRQRRGRPAARPELRHRLLRPRRDVVRRPVPDRPGGRPAPATRRPAGVQPRVGDPRPGLGR